MQELIKVESRPALLEVNFEEMRAALQTELEKYRVVVTSDTVKDAKELATRLNQTKKAINDRIRAEEDKAAEPIKTAAERRKELVSLIEEGRQHILAQVKRFEDETREKARSLLSIKRAELWELQGVEPEFQRADIDDLVLLTSVTGKGNLAASARTKLEARVNSDKALQDQTRMRLLALENQSYRAGLAAPLTRDHVEPFLFAEEEAYQRELDRIIAAEIERQKAAEERFRAQVESERRRKEEYEKRQQEAEPGFEESPEALMDQAAAHDLTQQQRDQAEQTPQPATQHPPAPTGKVNCTVTADFSICIDASVSDEAIQAELRRVMEKAGITSLTAIRIHRHKQQDAA